MLRTSEHLFQAYELHIRKPSFIVGNNGKYTQNIFNQMGLEADEFDEARRKLRELEPKMNLGAWVGPKEDVSAEPLTGNETGAFEEQLWARGLLTTELMRRVKNKEQRRKWGFKILGDVIHAREYARVWPNATFILLVRDPRDHALSIMQLNEQRVARGQKPFYPDYRAVAQGWKQTIDGGRRALVENGIRHVILRYEDLVREPQPILRELSDDLGVDLSEALEFYRSGFVERHQKRFRHHANLGRPINADSLDKWRTRMSDTEAAIFREEIGETMADYGYVHQ